MKNQGYKTYCLIFYFLIKSFKTVVRGSETSQYPVIKINRDIVSSGERNR